jgi:hypothetical protein
LIQFIQYINRSGSGEKAIVGAVEEKVTNLTELTRHANFGSSSANFNDGMQGYAHLKIDTLNRQYPKKALPRGCQFPDRQEADNI